MSNQPIQSGRWRRILQLTFSVAFFIPVGIAVYPHALQVVGGAYDLLVIDLVILVLVTLGINAFVRYFQKVHHRSVACTRGRALYSLYLAIPSTCLGFDLTRLATFDSRTMPLMAVAVLFGVLSYKLSNGYERDVATVLRRILIFGLGKGAQRIADTLQEYDPNVQIVGFYAASHEEAAIVPAHMILPRDRTLTDTVEQMAVDEIVVALSERRGGKMPLRELLDCKLQGIKVSDVSAFYEEHFGQICLDSLRAGWLIFGDGFNQEYLRSFLKRSFDVAFSSILLILATPTMLATTLLILIESGFPILYRQERVGLNGRLFDVIKFRSMRTDAEKDGKARWATANDSRVTRVGKFIRKLRIDELPQLFCVLKGDMSLVGPRPERPVFVEQLTKEIPFYAIRHSIKPGVTGWAQVRFHYGANVEDAARKLQYDLYYVKHHSLLIDLTVLYDTVGVVLTGKGAN